jgi:hypothetical protein
MGLDFPDLDLTGVKVLIEPMAVAGGQVIGFDAPDIRLQEFAAA